MLIALPRRHSSCAAQSAIEWQAAVNSGRPVTQQTVDVPWEPQPADPRLLDPRPFAAIARSKPEGAASLPPGVTLRE